MTLSVTTSKNSILTLNAECGHAMCHILYCYNVCHFTKCRYAKCCGTSGQDGWAGGGGSCIHFQFLKYSLRF